MWFALQARVDSHRAELMADAQEVPTARLARHPRRAAKGRARAQGCGEPAAALPPSTTQAPPATWTPSSRGGHRESTSAGMPVPEMGHRGFHSHVVGSRPAMVQARHSREAGSLRRNPEGYSWTAGPYTRAGSDGARRRGAHPASSGRLCSTPSGTGHRASRRPPGGRQCAASGADRGDRRPEPASREPYPTPAGPQHGYYLRRHHVPDRR
jgi:hypothetical protein